MIALAEQKAGLAWLDTIAVAMHGTPETLLVAAHGATEFYSTLRPESADELEAVSVGLDAIATARIHALGLLALRDLDA